MLIQISIGCVERQAVGPKGEITDLPHDRKLFAIFHITTYLNST